MSRWARVRLYGSVAAGAAGLLVSVGVALYARLASVWQHLAWTSLVVLPLYLLALWLVSHRPDHVQARRLLLIASVGAVAVALESTVRWAYREVGPGDWLWVANTAHQFTTLLAGVAVGVLLASYPDGHPERRWQRRVVAGLWCTLPLPLLLLLSRDDLVFSPYLFESSAPAPVPSPLTVSWLTPVGGALEVVYDTSASAVVGGLLLLLRYVQVAREQRLRMRPLVYSILAAAPPGVAISAMIALGVSEDSPWFLLASALLIPILFMFPVSIAISVLRYRVFDIDVVLRRSVVYGFLAAGIAVVYILLAAAPGLALQNKIPVQLAVILTVAAAVAFHPLRRRLESLADRWVFGERVNRYQLVRSFGAALEQAVDLHALLPRLAGTVQRGLRAPWVRVSLRGEQPGSWLPEPLGLAGTPSGSADLVEDLRHDGAVVGLIECGPRDGGYDQADRDLLTVLAVQAATAIANVRLTANLGEQVAELARSRARIVAAQDTERRRIERDIHDGVQQEVVALIAKLRLARNRLGRREPVADLLAEMQADAGDLLTDLRELAHGIHPPVLTDGGLVAAVEARAGRLPLGVTVQVDQAMRERRFDPDIEAAAYFVVCEALTNVVKHAQATDAVVSLAAEDGRLRLRVRDDGRGLVHSGGTNRNGQGLTNLRDRLEALGGQVRVEGGPGAGTTVSAALPIGADHA